MTEEVINQKAVLTSKSRKNNSTEPTIEEEWRATLCDRNTTNMGRNAYQGLICKQRKLTNMAIVMLRFTNRSTIKHFKATLLLAAFNPQTCIYLSCPPLTQSVDFSTHRSFLLRRRLLLRISQDRPGQEPYSKDDGLSCR